jgi:nucleoside phosphorylase
MVGIAGGASTEKKDMRLGDLIIGTTMVPYSFK